MPVQKAFSPAPVTMMQTTSPSLLRSAQASRSSMAMSTLKALWRSGRFNVRVATPPFFSTSRVW
jgi:hypothetical protein